MKVVAKRDDVHPGDDPEVLTFEVTDDVTPQDLLRRVVERKWLPSMQAGRATWSIESGGLLAVRAQEWTDLKFPLDLDARMRAAIRVDGVLQLRLKYHRQIDPEAFYLAACENKAAGADLAPEPAPEPIVSPTPKPAASDERTYVYQRTWRAILFSMALFAVAAAILAYGAVHDHRGMTIDSVVTLSPDQAMDYAWLLTVVSLAFLAAVLWEAGRRLTGKPRRLILTKTAVLIPRWRGVQSIDNAAIQGVGVMRYRRTTFLMIRCAGGAKGRIFLARMPSTAAFNEVLALLKARSSKAAS
jgi:hypothetical protein